MPRKYEQKKRAKRTAETRDRITQAAVDLHGTLGPARTTVSAIAEKAGVRRATVYEHFPDERSIFEACTNHFLTTHPLPDYHRWQEIDDPIERLTLALTQTYVYYQQTERMMALAHRDAELKPVMWEVEATQKQVRHWQEAFKVLLEPWTVVEEHSLLLSAAIQHALDFQTWYSLVRRQGLTDEQAVKLMVKLVGPN